MKKQRSIRPQHWKKKHLHNLTHALHQSYAKKQAINHLDGINLPTEESIETIIADLFKIIFPGYFGNDMVRSTSVEYYVGGILDTLFDQFTREIHRALQYKCSLLKCETCDCEIKAEKITGYTLTQLPAIRELLKLDIEAAYNGDPAATSFDEIILSYPCIKAITVHRVAHILYLMNVPMIPRMMSEWAHRKTGIDIHPGATIGKSFFIDHATGVVIGETTEIGNHVKIYQGVTLGAHSIPRDDTGKVIRQTKRHPTLKDNVTVYANATILGGDTIIGQNVIIGGNTWVTQSVKEKTVVTCSRPELIIRQKKRPRQPVKSS